MYLKLSKFTADYNPAPIGAIFLIWTITLTINAFKIFENSDEKLLPRIICYFDDLQPYVNNFNGEMAAINEFNEKFKNENYKRLWYNFKLL